MRRRDTPHDEAAMDKGMLLLGLTTLAAGLMSIVAAAMDLEAFLGHATARPIVKALGRAGARAFYAVLGIVFLTIGVFCTYRGLQLLGLL
jgi:hypothetical protein